MRLCGICHQPVESPTGKVMHPSLDGGILCGAAAKRTFAYDGEPTPRRPTADERVIMAQEELTAVLAHLRYHEDHEGSPVEVNTESGWAEMSTILLALAQSLGVSTE